MPTSVHVGRQPLFDTDLEVVGHELLFRAAAGSTTAGDDPGDVGTARVMTNAFTAFGVDALVGDGLAFINVTRPFLVGGLPVPVPPGRAVLELLEGVVVDDEVAAGAERLVAEGYDLALDDFLCSHADRRRLLPLVRYVKVDISQVELSALPGMVARLKEHDVVVVAERIEDAADLERCRAAGIDLFQGYHLLRPETLTAVVLDPQQVTCVELLRRLTDPTTTMEHLEALVIADPGLTVRLLHAANAASSGLRRRLGSVREALVMLGTEQLRAWVVLLVASDAAGGSTVRLGAALTRARACELLAPRIGVRADVAFTAGLLSALDVVLRVPMAHLLDTLQLAPELDGALRHGSGGLGRLLGTVAMLEGDLRALADGVTPAPTYEDAALPVAEAYLEAVAWSASTAGGIADGWDRGPTAGPPSP